jgi:hypothetical protein
LAEHAALLTRSPLLSGSLGIAGMTLLWDAIELRDLGDRKGLTPQDW